VSAIRSVSVARVFDSRGRETIEATIHSREGATGRAAAPSGESTGRHEAQAFPAGGVPHVLAEFPRAVAATLVGVDVQDQAAVDAALHACDGTVRFERIGGNVATAVSLAAADAAAHERGETLAQRWRRPEVPERAWPAIVGNCLNGGRHAIGGPDIQEYHAIARAPAPEDAVRAALAVHRRIGEELHRRFPSLALGRGDEGGWVAPLGNVEALEMLVNACASVRDATHADVHPGLDIAASELYRDGLYRYKEQSFDAEGHVGFVSGLCDRFGLTYVEDPFDQEAFDSFAALTKAVGARTTVVGDDLYTTSTERLAQGVEQRSTNAILIKVNQVGTLTDTFATIDAARRAGLATVTSHRSGDLPEGWLAHLAVASGAAGLKCGLLGGERVAKLNELLRLAAPPGA
jgi:enolase 1/2/3